MIDTLAYALGGRAAEELVFHEPTTGAGNDIEKATALARAMVTQYGMSAKLGAVKYGTSGDEPFLGRNMGHERDYSDAVAADIDAEVRALIELAHDEAWEILVEYRDVLDDIVLELMEKETLSTGRHGPHLRPGGQAPADGAVQRLRQADARPTAPPVLTPAEQDKLKAQAEADGQVAVGGGTPAANVGERALSTDGSATEPRIRRARLPRRAAGRRQARPAPGRAGRRPGPHREGRPGDPHRGRRGPGPRRPAAHPGPGGPRLRRAVRRPAGRPGQGAHHDVRGGPRRAGPGPGHRGDSHLRAPPAAVPRASRTSATSPAPTAGSPGCPSWPGWSRSTPGARRCRSG